MKFGKIKKALFDFVCDNISVDANKLFRLSIGFELENVYKREWSASVFQS